MDEQASAASEYQARLEMLRLRQAAEKRTEHSLGIAKLAVAAAALVAGVMAIHHTSAMIALPAAIVSFIVLAVLHEKALNSIRFRKQTIDYYERGLARGSDAWKTAGGTGERFLQPDHPYARDLDIFGSASLFQYLSTVRTPTGEETLAAWLLHAASPAEVVLRQEAVADLRGRLDFRERLASAGEPVSAGVHPESLIAWAEMGNVLTSASTITITTVLGLAWIASIPVWAVTGFGLPFAALTLLNFGYAHLILSRIELAAAGIEKAAEDLRVLSEVLALIEKEQFNAPRLAALKDALRQGQTVPSRAIRKLARLAEVIESRHSLFARPLDLVLFWSAQLIFRAESWKRRFGPAIRVWLSAVGEVEALAALATFAFEHPDYSFPGVQSGAAFFRAQGLAHPLLPSDHTVGNDVKFGDDAKLMILSGPNMAGKSTFIRSIGVNAVLAQCGAPVRARSLRMSPLQVAASICILDSLSGGISRFYAEIRRVKLISDLTDGPLPVIFLLDELLSGTNSHDRFVGTEFVLRNMVARRAVGVVSTHDLALTRIAESMQGRAFNAHFEDRFENDRLIFDYTLKPGVVQTSNALKLMRAIGLGVSDEAGQS